MAVLAIPPLPTDVVYFLIGGNEPLLQYRHAANLEVIPGEVRRATAFVRLRRVISRRSNQPDH